MRHQQQQPLQHLFVCICVYVCICIGIVAVRQSHIDWIRASKFVLCVATQLLGQNKAKDHTLSFASHRLEPFLCDGDCHTAATRSEPAFVGVACDNCVVLTSVAQLFTRLH